MNRDTLDAIVRGAVEAAPSPATLSEVPERDREHHELMRERLGLSEADYLARFVTSEELASSEELAEIARASRGGGRQ